MRSGMIGLCLMLSLTAVGCKSTVEATCDKAKECGTLGETSYDDCVENGNSQREKMEKDDDCSDILDKMDALADCQNDLSCDELKSNDSDKCKSEAADVVAAALVSGDKCDISGE